MLQKNKTGKSGLFTCMMLVFFLLVSLPAHAQQEEEKPKIKIGQLEIHPTLTVEGIYDDNIFLTNGSEEDDFITITSPGFVALYPFGNHSIDVSYLADLAAFSDHEKENYQNHLANVGAKLDFAFLYAEVRNVYNDTTDTSSSAEQANLDPRTRNVNNTTTAQIGYRISEKTKAQFNFSYYTIYYDKASNERLERDEAKYGGDLYYKILPKTSIVLGFVHSVNQFKQLAKTDPQDDSTAYEYNIGLSFDPDAKLTGEVRVGYENRDFEIVNDTDNFVASAGLTWFATPKFTARLIGVRSIENSSSGTDEYIKSNVISVGATNYFTDRLYGSFDFTYSFDDYNTSREDELLTEVVEAGYDLTAYLKAYVKYERKDNDSTLNTNDYEDNRVTVGGSFTY